MAIAQRRGLSRQSDFKQAIDALEPTFKINYGIGLSSPKVRDKLDFILEPIESATETILEGIAVLEDIVNIVAGFLDIVALALGLTIDIFETVLALTVEVLNQFKNFFEGTSISVLTHFPTEYKKRRTMDQILYDIGMAFLDKNDINAPVSTQNNFALTLIGMITVPNISKLQEMFERFKKLILGISDDVDPDKLFKAPFGSEEFLNTGAAVEPNFIYDFGLSDIAPINSMIKQLDKLIKLLSNGTTFAQRLNNMLNAVLARIERIKNILTEIASAISSLVALFTLGEGQNFFKCSGKGTNQDFANVIINAPNDPNFPTVETDSKPDNLTFTQVNKDKFKKYSFSGAFCLHLQAGVGDNIDRLEAIADLFMEDIVPEAQDQLKAADAKLRKDTSRFGNTANVRSGWTQLKNAQIENTQEDTENV